MKKPQNIMAKPISNTGRSPNLEGNTHCSSIKDNFSDFLTRTCTKYEDIKLATL